MNQSLSPEDIAQSFYHGPSRAVFVEDRKMRYELVDVNGIPCWRYEDGTVLPVMAGGQDPYEEALERIREAQQKAEKRGPEPLKAGSMVGQIFVMPDGSRYRLRLIRTSAYKQGYLTWRNLDDPYGGSVRFSPGTYVTESGRLVGIDVGGNVVPESSRTLTESERAAYFAAGGGGAGGGGAGGGGYAAPQWRPGELDLERQRLQADIADTEQRLEEIRMQEAAADERQRLQLQAEREMLEMRLENDKRSLIYSEYGATKRTLLQQQQSAREMAFQTREDPFAFAQAIGAFPMLGGTPAQTFRGNLQAFAGAPIPQMGINMPIPQMEQILGEMGGLQMPMPSPYVGMAGGGIIDMEKDDIFRTRPHKMSWLVGEGQHGEGLAMGTAEVLTIGDGKVEVTPFAGGAQGGMTVNPEAMKALLGPLFADISPGGFPLAGVGQRASWLSRFGYQPSFVRVRPGEGSRPMSSGVAHQYYLRTPEGGYREIDPYYITGPGAGRYANMPTLESAATLRSLEELNRLGPIGRPISSTALSLGYLDALMKPKPVGAFGPMSGLISEPTTGIMMPAPYQAAQELQRLRRENPTLFEGLLSAYRNAYIGGQPAGFTREAVLGQIEAATPQARYAGYTPQRIGWTGAQY